MKKSLVFGFVLGMLLVSMFSFVSAAGFDYSQSVSDAITSVAKSLKPIFTYTLGSEGLDSNLFLIKILVFVLMLTIMFFAAEKTPVIRDKTSVVWIVAIVVSILGTRFLTTSQLVEFVWLPSGVVGVALTSLLPFVLYFFFVESFQSSILRRVAWIFFTILFVALALVRWDALKLAQPMLFGIYNLAWIYILTAVVSILSFVFDKSLHAMVLFSDIEKRGSQLAALNISQLQTDIANWRRVISNPASTATDVENAKREIKSLEKKIKALL